MEHVSNSPALNSRGKAQNARVRPMQKRQGPLDFALLITVVIICAFGLVMVFSASYYYAQSRNMDNGFYYLKNQSMYFAIGFALMLALSFLIIMLLKTENADAHIDNRAYAGGRYMGRGAERRKALA